MQTPPEIVFQGVAGTADMRQAIEKNIAELEQRWGRVTACRIVVIHPSQHHHKGGLYEVHIRLALPDGREVNVERTASADERHADLNFALNDAFKRARRQLQDRRRRTEGLVKQTERLPTGTVVQLDPSGEFGFLETGEGLEVYFHRNSVLGDDFSRLRVGSRVTFAEEPGDKGPQATTVKLLGKHKLRA